MADSRPPICNVDDIEITSIVNINDIELCNRNPEPSAVNVAKDTNIQLDYFINSGEELDSDTIDVTINNIDAIVDGVFQTGFTGTIEHKDSDEVLLGTITDPIVEFLCYDDLASTVIVDSKAVSNGVLSVNTDTLSTEARLQNMFNFDGSSYGDISFESPAGQVISASRAFSIEFYFQYTASSTDTLLVGNIWSTSPGIRIGISATGYLFVYFQDGIPVNTHVTSFTPLVIGEFYHGIVSFDGSHNNSGINIYLNNQFESGVRGGTSTTITVMNNANLYMGGLPGSNKTNCLISNVRVYDYELSVSDIQNLYYKFKLWWIVIIINPSADLPSRGLIELETEIKDTSPNTRQDSYSFTIIDYSPPIIEKITPVGRRVLKVEFAQEVTALTSSSVVATMP